MNRIFKHKFKLIGAALLTLTALLGGGATYLVRRSFPQVKGIIYIPGLAGDVEVVRDAWGVPHIYASNQHDLFLAQGYIHAQDRFWQMDYWRHIGSGRLAELFGPSQVNTDKFLRTLGWARTAKQEFSQADANTREILQAYADGVNAYLGDHPHEPSLEHTVLKRLNPTYQPEPWRPEHTLTWVKVMALDLSTNLETEIQQAILRQTLTPAQISDLFPPYPQDRPIIAPNPIPAATVGSIPETHSVTNFTAGSFGLPALEEIGRSLDTVRNLLGQPGDGVGSNSWVISGQRTTTGQPILANDPHLGIQMPSIWYEVGLHCQPQAPSCPYNVSGFSFAGMPGVIIGHTDHIAWGVTNVDPDVADLFVETINPTNPDQYQVNGEWINMQLVQETIQVAGGEAVPLTVRYTRNGPIISDTYQDLENFRDKTPIPLPENYALALRWTALEPVNTFRAIWKMNQAQTWQDFRMAAKDFEAPSQNFVYADTMGNIGYQMTGKVPLRTSGDGTGPISGWDEDHQWRGYIPFEQLPFTLNPSEGYIATANNAVVGSNYPYFITHHWDYGYRAQRIIELIRQPSEPISLTYVQQMQADNKNLNAAALAPLLIDISMTDPRLERAYQILSNWDFQQTMDSAASAIFETFWKHLLRETFQDDLPKEYWPEGGDRWFEVVRRLVQQPHSPWWDNSSTAAIETRDQIFQQALTKAIGELETKLGKNPANWQWGNLHTATFRNASLGRSGVAPLEALFNRGPFAVSGGGAIVNATSWDAAESFEVTGLPSMRMIIDLSNLQNSLSIHTTGQSGHPFHRHYTDMIEPWRMMEYHPMLWRQSEIKRTATARLKLTSP